MVLLKVPRSHDLVLEFESEPARRRFLTKLEAFADGLRKALEMTPVYKYGTFRNLLHSFVFGKLKCFCRSEMLAAAETKERRTKRLEGFFREAYALTFGLK